VIPPYPGFENTPTNQVMLDPKTHQLVDRPITQLVDQPTTQQIGPLAKAAIVIGSALVVLGLIYII
jgi:hypothetical protein